MDDAHPAVSRDSAEPIRGSKRQKTFMLMKAERTMMMEKLGNFRRACRLK